MKAKVKLTDTYSNRSINVITALVNMELDEYRFDFSTLTNGQRRKIEDYFGALAAYYTKAEIIKVY